jgi:hypothetical protein
MGMTITQTQGNIVALRPREAFVRNPRLALAAALLVLWTDAGYGAGKRQLPTIKILEATYGGNCKNVSKGNVTRFVAAECNDKSMCNYRVYYKRRQGANETFPFGTRAGDTSRTARSSRRPAGAGTRAAPTNSA